MKFISKYWQKRIDDLAAIYDFRNVTSKEANTSDEWAIYTRYSTLEQRDGYTEEMQIRECEAFAERTGLKVGKIYSDRGRTGTNTDRPEYQNMQAAIKRGEHRGVLVHKIDRAFRNAEAMLSTFNNWTKKGIRFASATEMIDFTTPWGKLILAVLAMLAEIFIDNLRAETSKGKRGRFYEGIHNGPIPFGYCNGRCSRCTDPNGPGYCYRVGWPDLTEKKYPVPHPIDNEAVKHAFNLYETGAYTDEGVADALNHYQVMTEEGQLVQVRSKGKPGKGPNVFKKDMVNDLLQNLFYIGQVVYYGPKKGEPGKKRTSVKEHRQGLHTALITESQFRRCKKIT